MVINSLRHSSRAGTSVAIPTGIAGCCNDPRAGIKTSRRCAETGSRSVVEAYAVAEAGGFVGQSLESLPGSIPGLPRLDSSVVEQSADNRSARVRLPLLHCPFTTEVVRAIPAGRGMREHPPPARSGNWASPAARRTAGCGKQAIPRTTVPGARQNAPRRTSPRRRRADCPPGRR